MLLRYRDGVEMIRSEQLDAVVVSTAPRGREAVLAAAAEKKLPAFVEKPWASDTEQATRLAGLCRKSGARIMTGFSFRFLPAIERLRELLRNELGAPLVLTGVYVTNWLPPADHWLWDPANGGGYFNENSCHLFDSVNSLLGRPVSLYAQSRRCFDSPADDAALVTVHYEGGAIASLAVGGVGAGAFQDYPAMEVVAANGQAKLAGRHHIWDRLRWATRSGDSVQTFDPPPESLGDTRYTRALRSFCRSIREGGEFATTVDDGVLCVRMAEAIAESSKTGAPVRL